MRPAVTDEPGSIQARRGRLLTTSSPEPRHDYLVSLTGTIALDALRAAATVTLRFVPDRVVLAPGAFPVYLAALAENAWPTLEAVAAAALADINNELIPRWVQIAVASVDEHVGDHHRVVIEDRQPGWDNPAFIARLKRL